MAIRKVLTNLYKIEVPLPGNPLRALNSYVIKGNGRNLIIDTGMNRDECYSAMSAGLDELGIDLKKTDFFITHIHADHVGLVARLATESSAIYFNRADANALLKMGSSWERNAAFADQNGFPPEERQKAIQNHPARIYTGKEDIAFRILKEGDTVKAGDYSFRCIETPGHTRGHMCLYEADRKILVSGDHILIDITPNISLWSDSEDPLSEYLSSLDKVYGLDIKLVLPGHRRRFKDCQKRIRELKKHHEKRANEVLSILDKGSLDGYHVASRMTWDMSYETWDEFPAHQKWFAFGEAISHLKYLENKGKVKKGTQGNGMTYTLNN
ncbi:MAG: MBL fold metallo-hydrolase [Chloroflexota bacterium]